MLEKLSEKSKKLQEREQLVTELVSITEKYKTQLSNQDDLLKLAANKMYIEAALKLNSGSQLRTKK